MDLSVRNNTRTYQWETTHEPLSAKQRKVPSVGNNHHGYLGKINTLKAVIETLIYLKSTVPSDLI